MLVEPGFMLPVVTSTIVAWLSVACCTPLAAQVPLTVHVIFPYPNDDPLLHPSWYDGPQLFIAASLAAEHINSDPSLLRDYELRLVEGDGGCDITTKAAEAVVSALTDTNRVVGVIGPGCSASTLLATPVLSRQEVALINVHTAGSPLLANSSLYPFGISVSGSTTLFVNTTLALMEMVNWTRVAVFYEETRPFFSTTYEYLLQRIDEMGDSSQLKVPIHSAVLDTHLPLEMIRDEEIRIVYVLTGPSLASKIMCLADHMGLVSPNIQWLFFGRDVQDFQAVSFIYNSINYTCSDERMTEALEKNLVMNFRLRGDLNVSTVAHITYSEFDTTYTEAVKESGNVNTTSVWGPSVYDAVWSLALCLNNTPIDLTQYGPGQYSSTKKVRECFDTLNFTGVSGEISYFPQIGFIDRQVDVYQVYGGNATLGAYYRHGELKMIQNQLKVIDDAYVVRVVQFKPLSVFFTFVTVVLFLLIITCHVLTIVYRNYHSVKATSPKIAHFAYIGCYVLAVGTVINILGYGYGSTSHLEFDAWLCQICFGFLFPMGSSFIFGSILVRTWRIYRIFIHYLDPGKLISNKVLYTFISLLVGTNCVVAIIWTGADRFRAKIVHLSFTEDGGSGEQVDESYLECTCDFYFLWLGLVYGYVALEVIFLLMLSLLTRSVRQRDFTTKMIRVFVYLISLLFLIIPPIFYITGVNRTNRVWVGVNAFTFCLFPTSFLSVSLFVLFIPPLVPLLKNKVPCKKYEVLIRKRQSLSDAFT